MCDQIFRKHIPFIYSCSDSKASDNIACDCSDSYILINSFTYNAKLASFSEKEKALANCPGLKIEYDLVIVFYLQRSFLATLKVEYV